MYKKIISSPVGSLTIVASDKYLHALLFENHNESKFDDAELSKDHPILKQCEKELKEYFAGKLSKFTVPLSPEGTEFQKSVWNALKKIPYGKTISYIQQATGMGKKSAVRAVAAANGRNPIAIIIPCHRVVASTGHLHGFGGGLDVKEKLLKIEGFKIERNRISE